MVDPGQKRQIENNNLSNCFLLPCFYDNKVKEDFITMIIKETIEELHKSNNQDTMNDEHIDCVFKAYIEKVIKISSVFKSDSFSEESEWRLFHFRKKDSDLKDIKYRSGKSMIIPYIKFCIEDKYKSTPINEIIVGPCPHQVISKKSANMILKSYNIKSSVSESKIPFRKL